MFKENQTNFEKKQFMGTFAFSSELYDTLVSFGEVTDEVEILPNVLPSLNVGELYHADRSGNPPIKERSVEVISKEPTDKENIFEIRFKLIEN